MKASKYLEFRNDPANKELNLMDGGEGRFADGESENFNAEFLNDDPTINTRPISWPVEGQTEKAKGTLVQVNMNLTDENGNRSIGAVSVNPEIHALMEQKSFNGVFGVNGYGKKAQSSENVSDRYIFRFDPYFDVTHKAE